MAEKTRSKKTTAKKNATARVAERPGAKQRPKTPQTQKARSQERFPGETPLTGEDRPATKAGGKKRGQATSGRPGTKQRGGSRSA